MTADAYSGLEPAIPLRGVVPDVTGDIYEVRASTIPANAVPVYDDSLGAVIGYRTPGSVARLYDLTGTLIGMEEKGLEKPIFDPLDLIFVAGGIIRILGKGLLTSGARTGARAAASAAARLSSTALAAAVRGGMRATFKGLSVRALKFTVTTSARMAAKGRRVPMHILHLAIRHGKRVPDPKRVKGAFEYTTKMLRNGKLYELKVVVRETDWTILHFIYK